MESTAVKDFKLCWKENRTKGTQKAYGSLLFNGCLFTYSLNSQKAGMYLMRGQVSLCGQNGKVLHITGPRYREILEKMKKKNDGVLPGSYKNSDTLLAKKQITLQSMEEADIKEKILYAAEELYSENILAIQDDIKSDPVDKLHPSEAVRRYKKRYLDTSSRRITAETRRKKERNLERIASKLDRYTMDTISERELQRLHKELGGKANELFHLAENFWRFCIEIGVYQGKNPFEVFFLKNPTSSRRSSETLIRQLMTPKSLPADVVRKLRQEIMEADADLVKYTGLLLILEDGFPVEEGCALRWSDLLFNQMGRTETTVQFGIKKEFIAGATHNYTRPGSPFSALELFRRAEKCRAHWGTLEGHYILEDFNGKRLDKKALTEFCRERLLHCGMDYLNLAPDRSQPYGVGVRLLLAHYKYRITYLAGLQDDNGAVRFLQGLSLAGNVSADYYRSFTSPEGQNFLLNILSRDTFSNDAPQSDELIQITSDGESTTVLVHAQNPGHFNRASGTIRLEEGQSLDLCSLSLGSGYIEISKIKTE